MPIVRKLISQPGIQALRVDHPTRFIENCSPYWQFLFNPNSELNNSLQVLKLAAQLDTSTLDKIRIAGYLYRPATGSIDSAANIDFRVYRVRDATIPKWDDLYLSTISGTLQSNGYYYADVLISSISGANLDGETTLMIEGVAVRSGTTYRDRIYVNHLGVYDSVVRLRQDVEFLDITKVDE